MSYVICINNEFNCLTRHCINISHVEYVDICSTTYIVDCVFLLQTNGMVWYDNSLFDITEKYIVIAKYLIKYMIYIWGLHKEYTGCSLPCSHQGKC